MVQKNGSVQMPVKCTFSNVGNSTLVNRNNVLRLLENSAIATTGHVKKIS